MPDTDKLSARLDSIRAENEVSGASPADTALLLTAVDAVLAPHQPGRIAILGALCPLHENHRYFSITSTEAAAVVSCPDCTATVYDSCAGCGTSVRLDSCPVRTAISRALLGEDGTDAAHG